MTHDENGNMTSMTGQCGTTKYTWDTKNRLDSVEGFDEDCAPVTAQFVYDGLGRRVEKVINGVSTKYVYDGWDIVQEIEDSQVKWNYLRSLNIDEPLARTGFDGTKEFYHADMLGSITAITDEDGAVKTQYAYSPFGESTLVGEQSDNPRKCEKLRQTRNGEENDRSERGRGPANRERASRPPRFSLALTISKPRDCA